MMKASSSVGSTAASSDQDLAARLAAAGLPSLDELLGTQTGAALGRAVMESAVPRVLDACFQAPPARASELLLAKLGMLACFKEVIGAAEAVYERSLPQTVTLREGERREAFSLCGLDAGGRPIYQSVCDESECSFIAFHKLPGQSGPGGSDSGVWAARTTRDGEQPGAWQLNRCSELPTGAGSWLGPGGARAPGVACERADAVLAKHGCHGVEEFADLLREGHFDEVPGLLAAAHRLAVAWVAFAQALGAGDVAPLSAPAWPQVVATLEAVAAAGLGAQIEREMPFYLDFCFELSKTAIVTACGHALDLEDPSPQLMPLLHALVAQHMLREASFALRTVDVASQRWSDGALTPSVPGAQPFHVVSDTHEWDSWLGLPGGDVLLHCGDIMLDSGPLSEGGEPPRLANTLKDLAELAKQYRWVFFVGGNHDRTLHDLWAQDHARLCSLLPDNVVMLHCAPGLLDPPLPCAVAAKDATTAGAAQDGAVRLLPDLSLCSPAERAGEGWVIAGCGCSCSRYNNAFQFAEGDDEGRRRAYVALTRHAPDIILTHGPPSDDRLLKEAVRGCPSARVHAFGHAHHAYGVDFDSGKAFINAAIAGPELPPFGHGIPRNRPVMFYL
mmetsp:Transcript_41774/g.121054  ORF Transcript_41774/g.121054 Transcript_41774/m.121054 type:complete len:617 (-) Transcript_41774:129-1979(-)